MKRRLFCLVMAVCLLGIAGCGKKAADAVQPATEETQDTQEIADAASEAAGDMAQASVTDTELDTENLPEELDSMVHLMDSMNLALCNYQAAYDCTDAGFVWTSLLLATVNSNWDTYGFDFSEDGMFLVVPEEALQQFQYAMFGDLTELPEIPDELGMPDEYSSQPAISQDADGNYLFMLGDRGLSDYKVESFVDHGDGTYTAEVSLNEVAETTNEIVSFVYELRESTQPLGGLFAYEIVAAQPADKLTENKLAGIPYVYMYSQVYGSGNYEEDGAKAYTIEEVPWFSSFNFEDKSFSALNDRINTELNSIVEKTWEDEEIWADICSYLMTDDTYLQAVSTAVTYPNYATYGDVYSYNYDKKNKCILTNEDGLALADLSEDELLNQVAEAYKPENEGDVFDHAELGGFRIKQDGTVDFYLKLFVNNDLADDYNFIATYETENQTLHTFDGTVLIPDSEIDQLSPPLKHQITNT